MMIFEVMGIRKPSITQLLGCCAWRRESSSARGMTLIELLVVIALIAAISGAGVYMFGIITNSKLRSEAMRLTSVIQYTYGSAAMNNTQYRLILDLDTGEYYTEVTQSPVVVESPRQGSREGLLPEEAQELGERHRAKNDLFSARESDPFGVNRRVTFEKVQDAVVAPRRLRDGVQFYKVMTHHQDVAFESGKAAISFFPNGFQEQALIVLTDPSGAFYTLVTEPLTGRVKLYSEELDAPPGFGEVENDR